VDFFNSNVPFRWETESWVFMWELNPLGGHSLEQQWENYGPRWLSRTLNSMNRFHGFTFVCTSIQRRKLSYCKINWRKCNFRVSLCSYLRCHLLYITSDMKKGRGKFNGRSSAMRTPDISAGISLPNAVHVYWCGATYTLRMCLTDNNITLLTGTYSIFLVKMWTSSVKSLVGGCCECGNEPSYSIAHG
jgi:hypothetical protein